MSYHHTQHVPINAARIPAATTPQGRHFRVALVYKNIGKSSSGHIGLGVTAAYLSRYLQEKGIYAEAWGIGGYEDLKKRIAASHNDTPDLQPLTHVVISAPFLPSADVQDMAITNRSIHFAIASHSNIGFLSADSGAFRLCREYLHVQAEVPNFRLAGNSDRLAKWIKDVYECPCETLPNLYYLDGVNSNPNRPAFKGDTLRVGCFGALRPLKNTLSAGAAALQIARHLRVDLEFWISTKRVEGAPNFPASLREMFAGVHWAKIVENEWESWNRFRQTVRHMDLLMQPSYTESFNVVTADGIAAGMPSVVGPAISWAPPSWKANVDDPDSLAEVGTNLLFSPRAPLDGLNALTAHNEAGFRDWMRYLTETTPHR